MTSLAVPLYWGPAGGSPFEAPPSSVEASFSAASPSSLVQWGPLVTENIEHGMLGDASSRLGVAVGCEDGTIYVFEPSPKVHQGERLPSGSATRPENPTFQSTSSRLLSIGSAEPKSRSASPASVRSTFSPFQVTRSRIVSSVTNEQAEAPKVYVDYDDEPEKLKNLLKGKGVVRDKQTSEMIPSDNSSQHIYSPRSSKEFNTSVAGTHSPSPTSRLPSPSPYSQTFNESEGLRSSFCPLSLKCHVFPPSCARGRPVTLKQYDGGQYFACLQQRGELSIHTSIDGACIASTRIMDEGLSPLPGKTRGGPSGPWNWTTLHIAIRRESILFFACASPRSAQRFNEVMEADDNDFEVQSRVAVFELLRGFEDLPSTVKLDKIGETFVDGPCDTMSLRADSSDGLALLYISNLHRLMSQRFYVQEAMQGSSTPESNGSSKSLVNPFKVLKTLSSHQDSSNEHQSITQRIVIDDPVDLGDICLDGPWQGLRSISFGETFRCVSWSTSGLSVHSHEARHLLTWSTSGIRDVQWLDPSTCIVLYADRADIVNWFPVDADSVRVQDESAVPVGSDSPLFQCQVLHSIKLSVADFSILCPGYVLSIRSEKGRRRLDIVPTTVSEGPVQQYTLWKGRKTESVSNTLPSLTVTLPLDMDSVVLGYSNGELRHASLSYLSSRGLETYVKAKSDPSIGAAIVALHSVVSRRTNEPFIVGGADDGSVIIWSLNSLKLRARWTLFTTPLFKVLHVLDANDNRLDDCLFCVSQNGTIAVIALDGFSHMFLIPASAAPLRAIYLGNDSLLLSYGDRRARLWNIKTGEFWRSMDLQKAAELRTQGNWKEWDMDMSQSGSILSAFPFVDGLDHASALLSDVEEFIRQCVPPKTASTVDIPSLALPNARSSTRQVLRAMLSMLFTFGLNDHIDRVCTDRLAADYTRSFGILSHNGSSVFIAGQGSGYPWCISSLVSASRALILVSLLQVAKQHEDISQAADTVMLFYITSIPHVVGRAYQPPDLTFFAYHWLRSTVHEVRHAARLLFEAEVSKLSDEDTMKLIGRWHVQLPSVKLSSSQDSDLNATALLICGSVAVAKFFILPIDVLTDVSKSIALYLHDEASPHRFVAIDLCSRGFTIWQQYVDAVEMLRALFVLATTPRKNMVSVQNPGLQARNAVLQIASENPPLFMTTLTLDILHPRDIQHRKAVLQLVIFLIRKEPVALYSNLPSLVEAVVKSLDPTVTDNRDVVLDSATEILSHIVRTFPTVDFHMGSQRLAVGTSEGPVVMYDLKTATRLYVLEGHQTRTTACSFSPDGRRLVTVSLEESVVCVWKVGSSFSSFFMPGAPPRQGHGGSDPFKTLNFNVGDEATMSLSNTFQHVKFEWPSDRSVKLKIRDSVLTFST